MTFWSKFTKRIPAWLIAIIFAVFFFGLFFFAIRYAMLHAFKSGFDVN